MTVISLVQKMASGNDYISDLTVTMTPHFSDRKDDDRIMTMKKSVKK